MAEIRCLFSFEHRVRAGHGGGMHRHPCTEIVATRGGAGVLVHGERRFKFRGGDVLIYQPGNAHMVEQTQSGWHLCLGVLGCGAGDLKPGVYKTGREVERLCRHVRRALGNKTQRGAEIELLSGLLALELLRASGSAAPQESAAARVRNTIDTAYARPLSLAKLASAVFVSPDYLRQLFTRAYGVAPMRYLLARRIEVSRELLGLSGLTISEIAERCGFNDVFYFSRAFKKVLGMPPSAYRARYAFKPAGRR